MKKALVYGLGYNFQILMEHADLRGFEIVGYVDKAKCGTQMHGKRVLAPEEIRGVQYDVIFITPKKYEQIAATLSERYGVNPEKMILPARINREYILPKIKNARNIFFDEPFSDYGVFLFRSLARSGKLLLIDTLFDPTEYVPDEPDDTKKCFIFGGYDIERYRKTKLFESLKAAYPNADMVLFTFNKCSGQYGLQQNGSESFSPEYIKRTFDFCVTYHMQDAKKYGFFYYPQIYPAHALELEKCEPEADLFFIGNAKNRLELLHSVFLKLTGAGLRCRFWIRGVEEKDQIKADGLIYYSQMMAYEDALWEMNKCRCILEICEDGDETSYRYAEAVVYGKKLLLNDPSVRDLRYYSPENMQVFSSAEDIDLNWFAQPCKDYQYEGDLEPEYFLHQVLGVI